MDRPKRAATKVTDFRKYHLSGNLDEELQGRVDTRVNQFEMASTTEKLQKQLEEACQSNKKRIEDVEVMKIRNELEVEKPQQEQWDAAIAQLQEARDHAAQEHAKVMEQIKQKTVTTKEGTAKALEWLESQITSIQDPKPPGEEEKAQQEKDRKIQELREQQEAINQQLAELQGPAQGGKDPWPHIRSSLIEEGHRTSQEALLQQLKDNLAGRKEEDPNKTLLKALISTQNKTTGDGGTNTLKPSVLNSLLTAEGSTSMAQ